MWMVKGSFNKSKETTFWVVLQMEVILLGYWRKRLCVRRFWTFIKLFSSKCNGTIDNVWWLVFFMFHISHLVIFFLEDFCWVEQKGGDGNENSLDLMVILLLVFMSTNCIQIPSGKLYQAFSYKWKGWQITKFAKSCDLTWNLVTKTHTNENHSNIWMGNVKYHHWTLCIKKRLAQHVE